MAAMNLKRGLFPHGGCFESGAREEADALRKDESFAGVTA